MKMRKKALSLLLSAAFILSQLPALSLPEAATEYTECNVSSNRVDISAAGYYTITGSTTSNTITVDGSISGTVNITLSNVSIDVSGAEPRGAGGPVRRVADHRLQDRRQRRLIDGKDIGG